MSLELLGLAFGQITGLVELGPVLDISNFQGPAPVDNILELASLSELGTFGMRQLCSATDCAQPGTVRSSLSGIWSVRL